MVPQALSCNKVRARIALLGSGAELSSGSSISWLRKELIYNGMYPGGGMLS